MLQEALRLAEPVSGVLNHSMVFRLTSSFRLTFSALDYIGCNVNNDPSTDFERLDADILKAKTSSKLVRKYQYLRTFYLEVWMNNTQYKLKPMGIWNILKHSAPSKIVMRAFGDQFYYVLGEVWVSVEELLKYVKDAGDFAKQYFVKCGYVV